MQTKQDKPWLIPTLWTPRTGPPWAPPKGRRNSGVLRGKGCQGWTRHHKRSCLFSPNELVPEIINVINPTVKLMWVKQSTIPQITINRWYKPFPNGWFIILLPPLVHVQPTFIANALRPPPRLSTRHSFANHVRLCQTAAGRAKKRDLFDTIKPKIPCKRINISWTQIYISKRCWS